MNCFAPSASSRALRPARRALCVALVLLLPATAGAQDPAPVPEVLGGRRDVAPGRTQHIPILLNRASALSNINVTLEYDPAVAVPAGPVRQGSLVRQAMFNANANQAGVIHLAFAQAKALGVSRGVLAYIPFKAVGNPGDHTTLALTVTTAAGEDAKDMPVAVADGCLCIVRDDGVIPGDPNLDGRVTALDAWIALMLSVQKDDELAALGINVPRARSVCDVDESADVTSTDAAEILRMAAKQIAQGGQSGTRTHITGICSCIPAPVIDQPDEVIIRDDDTIKDKVKQHGGSEKTEDAVASALNWLARHQEADGHWDCRKYRGGSNDTAVTGLALLTFLGHGNSEAGGKYQDNVTRAVRWLIAQQKDDGKLIAQGDHQGNESAYAHAIAGMALAEAAAMANRPATRAAAQKALNYSCNVHPTKKDGMVMWRYRANNNQGDVSVTGWYIMQMHAAHLAKLPVPGDILPGAAKYLDTLMKTTDEGVTYGYTSKNDANATRTAIGALSRIYTDNKNVAQSIRYFVSDGGVPDWNKCHLYYWYYGTLATFQHGGAQWGPWNEAMKKALVENQQPAEAGDNAGSWDPRGEWSNRWGRVGQTALACLCLEVYYRYQQRGQ